MNEYVLILCLTLTAVAVTKVYTGINHIYTLAVTLGSARGKIKFSFFWQSPEAATFDCGQNVFALMHICVLFSDTN